MPNCSVLGCTNRTDRKSEKFISYHRFPNERTRRNEWLKAINREMWKPSKYVVICSEHFKDDCFDRSSNIVKLRSNAVPFTIHPKDTLNMSSCSVASCRNHRRSTVLHKKDVSYHRFPKNDDAREKWLKAVQPRKNITENHYVCSVHFLESDFERNLQAELLSLPKKRRLKPTAVPSLHMDESDMSNSEHKMQEITYECCFPKTATAAQNIIVSAPDNKYEAVIQRIDTLERQNYELMTSQQVISLNLKRDLGEEVAIVVPTSNLKDDTSNTKRNSTSPEIAFEAENNLRCRTCLEDADKYYYLTYVGHITKTIKEMITFCVPQMAATLSDDDVVCDKCLEAVQFCVKFIENCLEAEEKLQTFDGQETVAELAQEDGNSPDVDCVQKDHDYVIKSEPEQAGKYQNLVVTQPSILESLLVNQPQQNEPNRQTFKCPACDRLLKSQKFLANHIKRIHNRQTNPTGLNSGARTYPQAEEFLQITDRERFKCWNCGKLFRTENYLTVHLRMVHSLSQNPPKEEVIKKRKGGEKYVCKFCKCSFVKPHSYKIHLKRHNEKQADVCRVCGLKFSDKQELIKHRRGHGIICSVCFKGFSTRKEITEHRQTHPNIFFCRACGKGFKTKKSLTSHAEVHNAYCFYCSECGKGFKSNSALRYHKIIHDPKKKLRCDKCPSTFQDKTKLSLHQRVVHEKVREWKCGKCDRRFGLKIALKYHNRLTHLKLKIYQCENCGKRFGRRDYLKMHKLCYCKEVKEEDLANKIVEAGSAT